ncbi:MAG TPA: PsbP-related protein [Methanotrichaceae archaeon]|nr:PsbP-related protein [Methanotrichaceae archaeon]
MAILITIAIGIVTACAASQSDMPPAATISPDRSSGPAQSYVEDAAAAVPAESGSGVYENSTYGFDMSYPDGWIVKEADPNSMGMVVGFLAPGNNIDSPTNYVTVQTESLPSSQKITLDTYTSAITTNLNSSYKDFKLLAKRNITLGNLPGIELLYTMDNDGTPYEVLVQYTIKNDKAYVLTYYAQEDRYSQFEDGARELLGSFEFGGSKSNPATEEGRALLTPLPFTRGGSA